MYIYILKKIPSYRAKEYYPNIIFQYISTLNLYSNSLTVPRISFVSILCKSRYRSKLYGASHISSKVQQSPG